MTIEFNDPALEELYTDGSTKDTKYRKLSKENVKQYVKAVNYIRSARRIEDLYSIKSLHYEKRRGISKEPKPYGLITSIVLCLPVIQTKKE